jgi:hypothetical protein
MDIIGDMTMERDHMELSLGDTLDVKAGIVLAAITVLGSLTGTLLGSTPPIPKEAQIAQMFSLGFIAVGALFSVMAMVPREYLLPDTPEKYRKWIEDLKEYYKDNPAELESKTVEGLTQVATQRITTNHEINSAKSGYLVVSFWVTIAALTIDMVSLAAIALLKLLS